MKEEKKESPIEDSDGRKRLLNFFLSDMKKEVSTK